MYNIYTTYLHCVSYLAVESEHTYARSARTSTPSHPVFTPGVRFPLTAARPQDLLHVDIRRLLFRLTGGW